MVLSSFSHEAHSPQSPDFATTTTSMFPLGEHYARPAYLEHLVILICDRTWTDDTSMTLCLAQSLIENRGAFIAQTALRNYINWYQHGYLSATGDCFDIGTATTKALLIWGNYFEKNTNLEKGDPNGHLAGQPDVDKALKKEVSSSRRYTHSLMYNYPL